MPNRIALALSLAVLACTATRASRVTPSDAGSRPCGIAGLSADEAWRAVDGQGFTYCVPSSWRVVGNRASFAGGSIEWHLGAQREAAVRSVEITVEPMGNGLPATRGPARGAGSLPTQRDRTTEVVDDRTVELWTFKESTGFTFGAIWTTPRVYFVGRAPDAATVALGAMVYRTVRFAR